VTAYIIDEFESVDSAKIRVGGLPMNPVPPLNYMQLFSVHGLLNEYIGEADIIEDGKFKKVPTLSGLETLDIGKDFKNMEAFFTLGGTSTLPETFKDKVKNLDYKTIRYKGHRDLIKAMFDIGLTNLEEVNIDGGSVVPRNLLANLLEKNLPKEGKDVTLIKIEVEGIKSGEKVKVTYDLVDHYDSENEMTSMMRTTGYSAAIVGQMLARNSTNGPGALPQEKAFDLGKFLSELSKRNIIFSINERKTG